MVVALVEQGCLSLLLQLFGASARQSNKQRHDHQVSELPSTEVIMAPFLSNAANYGAASGIQHICDPSETQVPPRTLPESQIHSSVVSCPVAVVLVLRESARVANRVIGLVPQQIVIALCFISVTFLIYINIHCFLFLLDGLCCA